MVVIAAQGGAAMVGAIVLLLAMTMLLDWFIELPMAARTALLAIDLGVLAYILGVHVIWPIVFGPDDEDIALMVERDIPDFQTRLIASVQLGSERAAVSGASLSLVRAMIAQTESMASPMDFSIVVKMDRLLKTGAISALILVLGASAYAWGGEVTHGLLRRAFLAHIDVPRKTGIDVLTGNRTIAVGDPITIEADARRVIPSKGVLDIEHASGREQRFELMPSADKPDRFALTIDNVQESFSYRIRLNDARSPWFKVQATPRPAISAVQFEQEYPKYAAGLKVRRSPGDLSLLVGSKLHVKVRSSRPIKTGVVRMVGIEKEAPMEVEPGGTSLTGTVDIPARGLSGISFRLTDANGIASRGETVYPVDLVPDREPRIQITAPDRQEELATQRAMIHIGFIASDDFGVNRVVIRHKLDAQENAEAQRIDLDLAGQPDLRRVPRRFEFNLSSLKPLPPEGSTIVWWVEVHDGNDITGPGIVSSEPYRAKIVSEQAKQDELMHRAAEQLGTIDYVTQDQEKLNQQLGNLILEKKD